MRSSCPRPLVGSTQRNGGVGAACRRPWTIQRLLILVPISLLVFLVPVACVAPQPPSTRKPVTSPVSRHSAQFVLPQEPRHEHQLLLSQLEQLGVERFVPKDPSNRIHLDQDELEKLVWDLLPTVQSENLDLLWSTKSLPVFLNQIEFPSDLRTKINHFPGSDALLGTRSALWDHVLRMQQRYGKFHFHFVPPRFVLPRDQAAFEAFWRQKQQEAQYDKKILRDSFIFQRFLLHEVGRDDGIGTIVISNDELNKRLASDFAGKQVQATYYIEPFLMDGRKFKVGRYVALTSLDPVRIYIYNNGMVQISKRRYPPTLSTATSVEAYDFDDSNFINPWDFAELQRLFKEFPSPTREGTNSWQVTKQYLAERGLDTSAMETEMREIIGKVLLSAKDTLQSEIRKLQTKASAASSSSSSSKSLDENFFELWRFDFEISDLGKVYLNKIHANPSFEPMETPFGSDQAIKKNVLYDVLNLVGIPKYAKTSFDSAFFEPQGSFCADKCSDTTRTWDVTCWKCPKWFAPPMASKLFDAAQEYNRRGQFELIFPDFDTSYTKFLGDLQLSENDIALARYIKSLGSVIAHKQDLFDAGIQSTCVYREHCNHHGDCLNGVCLCDVEYEGATCYLPRGPTRLDAGQRPANKPKSAMQSWKERMEGLLLGGGKDKKSNDDAADPHVRRPNRRDAPEVRNEMDRPRDREDMKRSIQRQAAQAQAQLQQQRDNQPLDNEEEEEKLSFGTLLVALVVLTGFLYSAYSIFVSCTSAVDSRKNN